MKRKLAETVAGLALLGVGVPALSWGETYVLPAVVRGVPGMNGSYWYSELRVLRFSLQEDVTVRRLWVALPDGGFVDNPVTAPTWVLRRQGPDPVEPYKLLVVFGDHLLGSPSQPSHGAVALEITGAAAVYFHNVNGVGFGEGVLVGNGQLTPAFSKPLRGTSVIPWATSGRGAFRTSVGLINPSDKPLTVRVFAARLVGAGGPDGFGSTFFFGGGTLFQPWVVSLPPLGWRQLNDIYSSVLECTAPHVCRTPAEWAGPTFLQIEPDDPAADYYAYASLIYSPLNDPEFVPAIPGQIDGAVRPPAPCPPDCSGQR